MAAVCDMPDVPWQKIAVGTRHRRSLEAYFPMQKGRSKPLNDAFYSMFRRQINQLSWSDPDISLNRECSSQVNSS
jgi:hypothetical protein